MSNNLNCNYCYSCNSCNYCDYCNSCYYCYSCYYCNYCYSCNSCYYCDYCNSCNSCYSCKNLKMTEYNIFCSAKEYNDENSFQQKRYRIFNKQLTEKEYKGITIPKIKLEFDKDLEYSKRYQSARKNARDKLSTKEKQEFLDLPNFCPIIFKDITWIDVADYSIQEMTLESVCKELGRNIKIIKW